MEGGTIRIRRAREADVSTIAHFLMVLARSHVGFDAHRFVLPEDGEAAFVEFIRAQLDRADAVMLVAEDDSGVAGYVFVRMEPESIEDLRGSTAYLHDIYVDPKMRRAGVGRQLVEAAKESARTLGSRSLMLGVSPHNDEARRLFEGAGLRPTMVEMRVELDA